MEWKILSGDVRTSAQAEDAAGIDRRIADAKPAHLKRLRAALPAWVSGNLITRQQAELVEARLAARTATGAAAAGIIATADAADAPQGATPPAEAAPTPATTLPAPTSSKAPSLGGRGSSVRMPFLEDGLDATDPAIVDRLRQQVKEFAAERV